MDKKMPPGANRTAQASAGRARRTRPKDRTNKEEARASRGLLKRRAPAAVIECGSHVTHHHERNAHEQLHRLTLGGQRPRPRPHQTTARHIRARIRSRLANTGRRRDHHPPFPCGPVNRRTHTCDRGQSGPEHRTSTRASRCSCTGAVTSGWRSAERNTISFISSGLLVLLCVQIGAQSFTRNSSKRLNSHNSLCRHFIPL